jgi:response regulator RpfG family c-di-GMP phosphodiesterase
MDDVIEHDKSFAPLDPELYQTKYSLHRHLMRVGLTCGGMARALDWPQEEVDLASASGQSHDLGKLEDICQRYRERREFTLEDRQIMSLHPHLSAERIATLKPHLRATDHPFIDKVMHVVRCHHKPYWLLDEQLRRIAYCVKIADAWNFHQEDRGYSVIKGPIEAYETLRQTDFILLEHDDGHKPYLGLMSELIESIREAFLLPGLVT